MATPEEGTGFFIGIFIVLGGLVFIVGMGVFSIYNPLRRMLLYLIINYFTFSDRLWIPVTKKLHILPFDSQQLNYVLIISYINHLDNVSLNNISAHVCPEPEELENRHHIFGPDYNKTIWDGTFVSFSCSEGETMFSLVHILNMA